MTVLENCIEAPTRVRKVPRREAIEKAEMFLVKVHLIDKRDEYPARLSGGQKQRAAIARALTNEPQVLMFDEPTSALDQELIGDVLNVMEELAHEGTTMIVVTHEMHFAREAADRVVFMEEGRIVEDGPPDQVLNKPEDPRTQQFLRRFLETQRDLVQNLPGWAD
jgi:polar amino acid transport system ATP-binding protein